MGAKRRARPHPGRARSGGIQEARPPRRLEGGALGVGGAITAAPDIVALLWIQSRMVFYIAAAYGYDPHTDAPRGVLALQGLYDTPAQARKALDGVGKRMAQAMVERAVLHHRTPPPSTRGREVHRQAAGPTLRRQPDPVHRRPDRRDPERQRHRQLGQRALEYYARP